MSKRVIYCDLIYFRQYQNMLYIVILFIFVSAKTRCILWFKLFSSVPKRVVYCDLIFYRQCQNTLYIVI